MAPLLTVRALQHVSSAHSIVVLGLLPVCTALCSACCAAARAPTRPLCLLSVLGNACVLGYAAKDGIEASPMGDLLTLAAIRVCSLGYAEGARLSRRLGGWQVISWALVLTLSIMLPAAVFTMPASFAAVGTSAWIGLAYVSLFSMLIGFMFWYRGLALGGIAAVGQLQLLQPFFALALAASLPHEAVSGAMLLATFGAVLCVAGARRFAV